MDKSQRYATSLQNFVLKGFFALAALDQHEMLIKNQQKLISQVENTPNTVLGTSPKESASKKTDSGGSE